MKRKAECNYVSASDCFMRFAPLTNFVARAEVILEVSRRHAPRTEHDLLHPSPMRILMDRLTAETMQDLSQVEALGHTTCASCVLNPLLDTIPAILNPEQ